MPENAFAGGCVGRAETCVLSAAPFTTPPVCKTAFRADRSGRGRIRFADAGSMVRRLRSVYQRRRYLRQTAAAAPRRSGCGCVRRAPKDGLSFRIFCFSPNERQERSGISLRRAFLQSPRPAAGRFFVTAVYGRLFILPS